MRFRIVLEKMTADSRQVKERRRWPAPTVARRVRFRYVGRMRRKGQSLSALALTAALSACLIQRPPVPPEFLDLRYEVTDSTAAAAAAVLRGEPAMQEALRDRLPSYASQTHADTLVERMWGQPATAPLGFEVRRVLDGAIERSSGRVRGALGHADAQRQLVEAVVLGLGLALQRVTDGAPERRR